MPDKKKNEDSLLSALRAIATNKNPEPAEPEESAPEIPEAVEEDPEAPSVPPEDVMSAQSSIIINAPQYAASVRTDETPWALQQFFDGEIDLDSELSRRFPDMAVMATFKTRDTGKNSPHVIATTSTSDSSAQAVFDLDTETGALVMSFTLGSMLTLRFNLHEISQENRDRWLELMRRHDGGLAFLWGPERWEEDYIISVVHKYYTNLYAFSPANFEAGIRMTTEVIEKLLDWLAEVWGELRPPGDDEPPQLLTW